MKQVRSHLLVAFVLAIVVSGGLHLGIRNVLIDLLFRSTPRAASGEIVLVAIDPRSIDSIGVWPWPRTLHAQLIDQLRRAGVDDIVFDVDFSTPSTPEADAAFAAALRAASGSVVLPSFRQPTVAQDGRHALHLSRPLPAFLDQSWSAIVNVAVEPDGRVRRYPVADRFDGQAVPSMAAVLAGQGDLSKPPFLIDFGIQSASVPVVSYVDVVQGRAEALRRVSGKKVIIGGTALELGDRFSVPNGAVISGPLLQALAAESMLQGRALYFSSGAVTLAGLLAIASVMVLAWRRISAGYRVSMLMAIALAVEAGAWALQHHFPIVLDTSLFLLAIGVYLIAIALDEIDFRGLLARVAEKRFQRITMVLGDGVMCADSKLAITMWNPGAEAIFGYTAREVIGRSVDMLFAAPADHCPAVSSLIFTCPPSIIRAAGGWVLELDGRRKTGETFSLEACLSGWDGPDGINYGASLRDISVRKREAERIRYLAEHDTVTGLPNRNTLQNRLGVAIAMAGPSRPVSLLAISIDNFERTNVMLGHGFGDDLLRAVAERMSSDLGNAALIARLDGDQFALLAEDVDRARAMELAARCTLGFEQPLRVGDRVQQIAVSIGIAVLPGDGETADAALGNAQLALVQATLSNATRTVLYKACFRSEITDRLRIEAELVRALGLHEFELFYQPQVSLADRRVIGAEALIRWRHPERGLVPPIQFMPIVNASAISNQVASWVLHTACRQGATWAKAGHGIRIGVNLSPSQFRTGDLPIDVATVLAATGLQPSLLELEVTEDILLDDKATVQSIFRQIQDLGVRVVFDDFGTGYGSLSYLKNFPLDGLKIDRSFVQELAVNRSDAAIVGSTIELGERLGLSVIAEGIEDDATAELLVAMGCAEGQGYYFGKPMPAAEFESMFFANRNSATYAAVQA